MLRIENQVRSVLPLLTLPKTTIFGNVVIAKGGLGELAKQSHLNRQSLYQTLSSKGNPRLMTLGKILKVLGFHLSIESEHAT